MTDKLAETIKTYEHMAEAMSQHFRDIGGARKSDVDKALELLGPKDNPFIFEIGCADGRDAAYIIQKTKNYIGIDPSATFIRMAQKNVKGANFQVADARSYRYPENIDIVIAFASLLHLSMEECSDIFKKLSSVQQPGGIVYLSLKWGAKYESYTKDEQHGKRLFYLYNPELIQEIAGSDYTVVFIRESGFKTSSGSEWFEMALQKQ